MRMAAHYSHLNGLEYLLVHQPVLWDQIQSVVSDIDAESCRTKISEEKTKRGRRLYSPIAMNNEFSNRFTSQDWDSSRAIASKRSLRQVIALRPTKRAR